MAEKLPPLPKSKYLNLRIDAELYALASKLAGPFGGLSAVMRALLRLFVSGAVTLTSEHILQEHRRSPKKARKRRKK
jgi:hypothetical protein